MEIFIKDVLSGPEAVSFFRSELARKVNWQEFTARMGKWVSRKSYDRSVPKNEADVRSVAHDIAHPGDESLETTHIGGDLSGLEVTEGGGDCEYTLKVTHGANTTTIPFAGMVVEHNVMGREIGSKQSKSSYAFLIGAPFNSRVNLVIFRHRPAKKNT